MCIKYGIHSIDKNPHASFFSQLDSIIKDIIAKMQEFKDVRWPQVDFLFLLETLSAISKSECLSFDEIIFKSGKKIPQA